ncbi:hypothetical protein CABS01_13620 [Colletotrichum abscissum]|uniref:Uncharacterized protein n=1 Tax=Colletotrichum abscissum TaxID=1671311 RepID=A0A9Q0B4F0_9PEZI|nr:uncharacterized protein CABS01_13620 [Colletotrichum abscissum]KAI3548440.1 hypothetical protein CABS02_08274 [Colletotrichum abscissum]KAK1485325.1 hypothetical protein CABS01_13620 [Colletotrichum abscissum]
MGNDRQNIGQTKPYTVCRSSSRVRFGDVLQPSTGCDDGEPPPVHHHHYGLPYFTTHTKRPPNHPRQSRTSQPHAWGFPTTSSPPPPPSDQIQAPPSDH